MDGSADRGWSRTELENLLLSLQLRYPRLRSSGVFPLDFNPDSIVLEESTIGVCIFNLDRTGEPGSHWVSLYTDLSTNELYYFDSLGDPPPVEIKSLIQVLQEQYQLVVWVNLLYMDSRQCGTYALGFVLCMLNGVPPNTFFQKFAKNGSSIISLKQKLIHKPEGWWRIEHTGIQKER